MLKVSVGEAKNRLPYFLHLVEEKNEEIQITRHGKPVAFINGKDAFQKLERKQKYLDGLKAWRNKYADCLLSNKGYSRHGEESAQASISAIDTGL